MTMGKVKNRVINTLDSLINKIREELEHGRNNARATLENEKIATYKKIGELIDSYLETHETDYGSRLFETLSENLGVGKRLLYQSVKFYKTYPDISKMDNHLTWSHYRLLLTVKEPAKRNKYERAVMKNRLSSHELQEIIRKEKKHPNENLQSTITEKKGILYTYRLKQLPYDNKIYIDCGFKIYKSLSDHTTKSYPADTLLKVTKGNRYTFHTGEIKPQQLYTYKAKVKEIVDGDTLWLFIDQGFGMVTEQKVRLRGINTANLKTNQGKAAKEYVIARLKSRQLVVKTYSRDIFDRYLADIYYSRKNMEIERINSSGRFLNQELLDEKIATKYYLY